MTSPQEAWLQGIFFGTGLGCIIGFMLRQFIKDYYNKE